MVRQTYNRIATQQIDIKMAFQPIALPDTQSANRHSRSQGTSSPDSETAHLPSHAQATPLVDLEGAYLPHESHRDPSRPPSYVEEGMAEPLPTYMDSIKQKMKQAMRYPNNRMSSKPLRLWLSVIVALVFLSVIAIPIAVGRAKIDSSGPQA